MMHFSAALADHMRDPRKLVPGARLLARWLEQLDRGSASGRGASAWLAKRLNKTPGLISQYKTGLTIPSPEIQHALEILNLKHLQDGLTTVPLTVQDWWTPEQRASFASIVDSVLDFDPSN